MKIYALIGKSGTGKSYQAVNLCRKLNIESIIDDGLFIYRNKVIAGESAKRQPTKIRAVKAAIFDKDVHRDDVAEAIARINPKTVLVLGTSDAMVEKIVARLGIGDIDERIYIEDITSAEEREIARKQRKEKGEHIIPAPTFQLKRQFSGYFMSPLKLLQDFGPSRFSGEKSVVRPTFSYLGDYRISEKVMSDIVSCVAKELPPVYDLQKITIGLRQAQTKGEAQRDKGLDIRVIADFCYGVNLPESAKDFQTRIAKKIEDMTAFNVNRVDLEVRDIV